MRPLNVGNGERSTERGAGIRDGCGVIIREKLPVPQFVPKLSLKDLFEGTGDHTLLFSSPPCLVFLGLV